MGWANILMPAFRTDVPAFKMAASGCRMSGLVRLHPEAALAGAYAQSGAFAARLRG